jgi:hypothetical protein
MVGAAASRMVVDNRPYLKCGTWGEGPSMIELRLIVPLSQAAKDSWDH